MKKFLIPITFITLLTTSCATIIGGAKYNAKVQVPGHPLAEITVNGEYKGTGEANFKVKRIDADKLSITVKDTDCQPQTTNFSNKTFRGWAFVGSLVGWTGMIGYIPLPWGVLVDGPTGALWKPDTTERGVTKIDYDNYLYTIEYNNTPSTSDNQSNKNSELTGDTYEKLSKLKKLLDEGILTQNEYNIEKAKILNN